MPKNINPFISMSGLERSNVQPSFIPYDKCNWKIVIKFEDQERKERLNKISKADYMLNIGQDYRIPVRCLDGKEKEYLTLVKLE